MKPGTPIDRTHVERLIASRTEHIHTLTATDSRGKRACYVIYVSPCRERLFLAALKGKDDIELTDYGVVIASCYGEKPNDEMRQTLRERYGFIV